MIISIQHYNFMNFNLPRSAPPCVPILGGKLKNCVDYVIEQVAGYSYHKIYPDHSHAIVLMLDELEGYRGRLGLGIERDLYYK